MLDRTDTGLRAGSTAGLPVNSSRPEKVIGYRTVLMPDGVVGHGRAAVGMPARRAGAAMEVRGDGQEAPAGSPGLPTCHHPVCHSLLVLGIGNDDGMRS
jgi:hypothetical protein